MSSSGAVIVIVCFRGKVEKGGACWMKRNPPFLSWQREIEKKSLAIKGRTTLPLTLSPSTRASLLSDQYTVHTRHRPTLALENQSLPLLSLSPLEQTSPRMPRSKRDKVVALTEVKKKGKAVKSALIDSVRESADQFSYVWVFQVEHMRNNLLQEVRSAWKGSKIFLGRNAVMRKGLGSTKEDECRLGVSKIANVSLSFPF